MRLVSLTALIFLCTLPTAAQETILIENLLDREQQGNAGTSDTARLRVTNAGAHAMESLAVLFPRDHVEFGDIPAGATTPYKDVPGGIYGYAAFQMKVRGRSVTQPVADWSGASPMEGKVFTYKLDFNPGRPKAKVWLIEVRRDE